MDNIRITRIVFLLILVVTISSTSFPCFKKVVIDNIKTIDGGGDVKVIGEFSFAKAIIEIVLSIS